MSTPSPAEVENLELGLIQVDTEDLVRAVFSTQTHSEAGILVLPTVPLLALVTEESYSYIKNRPHLLACLGPLPSTFAHHSKLIAKARASIKLFGDKDGDDETLVELLALAREKSERYFKDSHRGILVRIVRRLRPDLGIYFAGEHAIATTHTVLPGIGVTREELRATPRLDIQAIRARSSQFGLLAGHYLGHLMNFFGSLGRPVSWPPIPLDLTGIHVSYNDVHGSGVIAEAIQNLQPADERYVGLAIMALCHINSAVHLFPRLLPADSNLHFRIQFLSAYHGLDTLRRCLPRFFQELPPMTESEQSVLRNRPLRNVCAHYGLHKAAHTAIGGNDPFGAAIEHHSSLPRGEVTALVSHWLTTTSSALTDRFSKSKLAPLRAVLGSHS